MNVHLCTIIVTSVTSLRWLVRPGTTSIHLSILFFLTGDEEEDV